MGLGSKCSQLYFQDPLFTRSLLHSPELSAFIHSHCLLAGHPLLRTHHSLLTTSTPLSWHLLPIYNPPTHISLFHRPLPTWPKPPHLPHPCSLSFMLTAPSLPLIHPTLFIFPYPAQLASLAFSFPLSSISLFVSGAVKTCCMTISNCLLANKCLDIEQQSR